MKIYYADERVLSQKILILLKKYDSQPYLVLIDVQTGKKFWSCCLGDFVPQFYLVESAKTGQLATA